ncbi:NAD(P)-dependent oxidoreductase [Flammeovirgaceae bacterium SG7u.111]|nr:NAD(P)-dependent oxidoreductase [Flammeovirgaceae bacterium SG7u.132]WPO34973.1 NAD(P)-dependent oxidoreductase [Flammeovirgaceae bacterium SG7u.111]
MIIGKGLIASRFESNEDYHLLSDKPIIFASGVSNSAETDEKAYNRERQLLYDILSCQPAEKLIYFSTISVYDPSLEGSKYIQHKIELERYIQENHHNHLIIRTSNIVGKGGNPHTLVNYFVNAVLEGKPIKIWKNATRNILDIDDLVKIVLFLLHMNKSGTHDIYFPLSYTALALVETIGIHTGIFPKYELINKGADYIPSATRELTGYFKFNDIAVNYSYFEKIMAKYWPNP